MTDVFKCAVYYDSANLPVLCHDHNCVDCKYECSEAVVKIIPIDQDEVINLKGLDELSKTAKEIKDNLERAGKEFEKTVNSFSKMKKRI